MGQRPQVIFLDAVGTLFGVRDSVGKIYSDLAYIYGVEVSAAALNQGFRESFRGSGPAAFPGVTIAEIPQREFEWWRTIAQQTFHQAGVLYQFANFDGFFQELYELFASPSPWVIYPDVYQMLPQWQAQGIALGILSNFDTRLYRVLQALNLEHYFASVTVSTEVGAAKPDSQIFQAAMQKHQPDSLVWHIGDSYTEDYLGANAAGLTGIWLCRDDPSVPQRTANPSSQAFRPIKSLIDLSFENE